MTWLRCGGRGLQVEEGLTILTRFASFDEYWAPFLAKQGPAVRTCRVVRTRAREAERRLRKRLLGEGPDRPVA